MQKSDPIVDEVRAARDAIAKEFDYDIEKLASAIKAREVSDSGVYLVTLNNEHPNLGQRQRLPHCREVHQGLARQLQAG